MEEVVKERILLVTERIREIEHECASCENGARVSACGSAAGGFFAAEAGFILMLEQLRRTLRGEAYMWDEAPELLPDYQVFRERNRKLYEDILGEAYEHSYANPAFAASCFGLETGRMMAFLAAEIRGGIAWIYEGRLEEWAACLELFVESYNLFEAAASGELGEETLRSELAEAIYFYVSDYTDVTVAGRVRAQLDPSLDFAVRIVTESDLTDLRYLYRFGEYISENTEKTAKYLNTLPEETIEKMASVYTEGYRRGFELAGIDLSKKKIVELRYEIGFERVLKCAIRQFAAMGLKPVLYRAAVSAANKRQHIKIGYFGAYANRQYEYDHRFDNALFLDKAFKERKLAVMKVAYEEYKDAAAVYAGPAVMETFGEEPFAYVSKPEALSLSKKQKKLSVELTSMAGELVNQYIKGEERSFTIISWPVPQIGPDYEQIFAETIQINTLDYEQYKAIQGVLIAALDQAEYVIVKGRDGNETDLRIRLHPLSDPEKETKFENCLADVNIPLGEVFTSPKLHGTCGLLHVKQIYINEVEYLDLKIRFEDGMTADYSCRNYETEAENRAMIEENLLYSHPALPMGEFAIGTNTTAYRMAADHGIMNRMQILIIEKMGPHFAIGDTCYSHSESVRVFNPDGKEIIAKENECSVLRNEDPGLAYFNCHTDITIPYEQLGEITAVSADGKSCALIRNGRFVLPGTEVLNEALDQKKEN